MRAEAKELSDVPCSELGCVGKVASVAMLAEAEEISRMLGAILGCAYASVVMPAGADELSRLLCIENGCVCECATAAMIAKVGEPAASRGVHQGIAK
jgi:hypothetical protein